MIGIFLFPWKSLYVIWWSCIVSRGPSDRNVFVCEAGQALRVRIDNVVVLMEALEWIAFINLFAFGISMLV